MRGNKLAFLRGIAFKKLCLFAYIFFYFFDTHEQANAYAKTREYNVLIWLFSAIYGDPSWLTTKVYNQIEIEYDQAYLYEPFEKLLQS